MKRIPGYSIVSRAIVYCARILSLQYGKEYTRKKYGEVKKVISFWIMPQSAQYLDGVVEITRLVKYSPRKRRIEEKEAYDKICIVEMYISKDHDIQKKYEKYDEVLTPLFVLLTNKLSIQDKKRILKEYGFKVDEDLERSLDTMCNLSVGIREEGRCEGKIEEMINGIRNMIESFFMLHVQKEECIQIVTEKYPSIEKEKVIAMTNQFYG